MVHTWCLIRQVIGSNLRNVTCYNIWICFYIVKQLFHDNVGESKTCGGCLFLTITRTTWNPTCHKNGCTKFEFWKLVVNAMERNKRPASAVDQNAEQSDFWHCISREGFESIEWDLKETQKWSESWSEVQWSSLEEKIAWNGAE